MLRNTNVPIKSAYRVDVRLAIVMLADGSAELGRPSTKSNLARKGGRGSSAFAGDIHSLVWRDVAGPNPGKDGECGVRT